MYIYIPHEWHQIHKYDSSLAASYSRGNCCILSKILLLNNSCNPQIWWFSSIQILCMDHIHTFSYTTNLMDNFCKISRGTSFILYMSIFIFKNIICYEFKIITNSSKLNCITIVRSKSKLNKGMKYVHITCKIMQM